MVLIFGSFSLFGNYSRIELSSGAIANIRDTEPLVADLVGGSVIGLVAGLIGGANRIHRGGLTALPCSVATISAGIIGGLIYQCNKKEFIGAYKATIIAVLLEFYHMRITLILAKSFDWH
ncbi:MAG: LytS/YhcK type 5TM receptor domain-containing protein [Methanofastidiosum sp.]|jgi:sigma-B regulation protein RsbU (phosphoserine phosphatase)